MLYNKTPGGDPSLLATDFKFTNPRAIELNNVVEYQEALSENYPVRIYLKDFQLATNIRYDLDEQILALPRSHYASLGKQFVVTRIVNGRERVVKSKSNLAYLVLWGENGEFTKTNRLFYK